MKRRLAILLVIAMILAVMIPGVSAAGAYDGKTVIIATANVKGDVDVYGKVAALKDHYKGQGAAVLLVDAGNYLQGAAAANIDRGETIYGLMDVAGYDVAAMGPREFYFGNATTGMIYHSNLHKFYTQKELYRGAEAQEYGVNAKGDVKETRPAKDPAKFSVISSNITKADGYYDFDANKTFTLGSFKVGIYALTDDQVAEKLQDNFMDGYVINAPESVDSAAKSALKSSNFTICLNNSSLEKSSADLTISAPADGKEMVAVYAIDNKTKEVKEENAPTVTANAEIAKQAADAKKAAADHIVFTNSVLIDGADRDNWCSETNLGDLVADALKWYGENKFEGFKKDAPVIAIQNGGNCDQFMYEGDITDVDLLYALPFSPMGIGLVYITGEDLLNILEAGTSPSEKYGDEICPGFAQVSGIEYEVHAYKEYAEGEPNGSFYKHTAVNRVVIKSVNGKDWDPKATYALVADNFNCNGGDNFYTISDIREKDASKYMNNGNGLKTRDIVAMYIKEKLNNKLGEQYAEPQGRITVYQEEPRPFDDVKEGCWYDAAASFVYKNGLMEGTAEKTFSPDVNFSRAMIAQILYAMAEKPAVKDASTFKDVPAGKWYTNAVTWCASKGIVSGYPDKTFKPDAAIKRQEIATILRKYAEVNGKNVKASGDLSKFSDQAKVSNYAKDAMKWAVGNKMISGNKIGSAVLLDPLGTTTRAQAAVILKAYCENILA